MEKSRRAFRCILQHWERRSWSRFYGLLKGRDARKLFYCTVSVKSFGGLLLLVDNNKMAPLLAWRLQRPTNKVLPSTGEQTRGCLLMAFIFFTCVSANSPQACHVHPRTNEIIALPRKQSPITLHIVIHLPSIDIPVHRPLSPTYASIHPTTVAGFLPQHSKSSIPPLAPSISTPHVQTTNLE